MGGLGDAACPGRCPAGQVRPGQHPQPGQGWRMLQPHRGHPHSPRADLEVLLCRAAGLPEQHWRESLDKHGAHPTAAAPEKPSSHARIYRKSLHESINSSPTDAAGNTSPVWGELREMELTPAPAPSPAHPTVSLQCSCGAPSSFAAPWRSHCHGQRLLLPTSACSACQGAQLTGDPSSELGARASLLRFWDWERGWGGRVVMGAGWGGGE